MAAAAPGSAGRPRVVMNLHQVLTGAVNPGDNCFSVGSLHDQPFTVSPRPHGSESSCVRSPPARGSTRRGRAEAARRGALGGRVRSWPRPRAPVRGCAREDGGGPRRYVNVGPSVAEESSQLGLAPSVPPLQSGNG